MEQLIFFILNLIFGNMEILFLILFGIAALLFKKKKEEEAARQRSRRSSTQAAGSPITWKGEEKVNPYETVQEKPYYPYRNINEPDFGAEVPSVQDVLAARLQRPASTTNGEASALGALEPPTQDRRPSDNSIHMKVGTKDVIQGMMWAEVFGSPRAKRPYRSPVARNK